MRITTGPVLQQPQQALQSQQAMPSVLLYNSGDQPNVQYQEPVYYYHSVHQQQTQQIPQQPQQQPQQPPMYYYAPVYPSNPQHNEYERQQVPPMMPLLQPYQAPAPQQQQQAQHFNFAHQQAQQKQQKANGNNQQREAEHSKQIHQKVQENEQLYVIHKVQPYDNLMSLSIAYNTTEDAIMSLNNMISNDLGFYSFKELVIPKVDVEEIKLKTGNDDERLHKIAEERKHAMLRRQFKAATGEENADIATYYLDSSNWESLDKAVEEYKKDLQWEKSQKQHVGGNFNPAQQHKTRKNSANKSNGGNWVSNLFKL